MDSIFFSRDRLFSISFGIAFLVLLGVLLFPFLPLGRLPKRSSQPESLRKSHNRSPLRTDCTQSLTESSIQSGQSSRSHLRRPQSKFGDRPEARNRLPKRETLKMRILIKSFFSINRFYIFLSLILVCILMLIIEALFPKSLSNRLLNKQTLNFFDHRADLDDDLQRLKGIQDDR